MSVCKPFANYSTKHTNTQSYTLHCSGSQRDICPVILLFFFFHLVSILRTELRAHFKGTTICLFLSRFVSHTLLLSLSLSGPRLCTNHAQTETHLCKGMLWEGFNTFFDHCSSDSKSAPKIVLRNICDSFFDIDVLGFNILIMLIFL